MTAGGLRCVRFEDQSAFLEATKAFDDSFMSFCLGPIYDTLSSPQYAADTSKLKYFLAIYHEAVLLISATHDGSESPWRLSVPATSQDLLTGTPTTPALLQPAAALLATSILDILSSNPLTLKKMLGCGPAVEAFLAAWTSLLSARNLHVRISVPAIEADNHSPRISYATRASLPPPSATPFPHPIAQATPADLADILALYTAFQPWNASGALSVLAPLINAGLVWFVRVHGEAAGYVRLGRATPRTVAILNVYVTPPRRRQGIAEAMVRGVTRYYLDAPPYGVLPQAVQPDGGPLPLVGFKAEVNLAVADGGPERLYRRSGFLFPERSGDVGVAGGVDPATGRKAWYECSLREVQQEQESSSETEHSTVFGA